MVRDKKAVVYDGNDVHGEREIIRRANLCLVVLLVPIVWPVGRYKVSVSALHTVCTTLVGRGERACGVDCTMAMVVRACILSPERARTLFRGGKMEGKRIMYD